MIKIDDTGRWKQDVGAEIRRLEIMLFDMNMLWSGQGYPPKEELSRAPTIWQPTIEPRQVPALLGLVGQAIKHTSPVVLLGDGWCRTWNSLYRLEERKTEQGG